MSITLDHFTVEGTSITSLHSDQRVGSLDVVAQHGHPITISAGTIDTIEGLTPELARALAQILSEAADLSDGMHIL
ncbi:hypothetical protein [Rhodococcus sp. NPDC060176]|uniref:hypothetical protein n=1 Tax=Rhodococcus sp. NPDC060176 TaxID=3347062 RepID=UPI00364F0931